MLAKSDHPSPTRAPLRTVARRLALSAVVLLLAACNASPPPAKALTPQESALLTPKDYRLAGLYEQSCKSCHTVADTGAPLAGDRTKWDPRWKKGEDQLLKNTVSGVGGMPAGGQCFSCSPTDYRALIRFMAGKD